MACCVAQMHASLCCFSSLRNAGCPSSPTTSTWTHWEDRCCRSPIQDWKSPLSPRNRKPLARNATRVGILLARVPAAQSPAMPAGRLGSGDVVAKAGEDRDRIAKRHGFMAFRMEGAGRRGEVRCIVVKSVCDCADSHKHEESRRFAGGTAIRSAVGQALLERCVLPVPSPLARVRAPFKHLCSVSCLPTPYFVPPRVYRFAGSWELHGDQLGVFDPFCHPLLSLPTAPPSSSSRGPPCLSGPAAPAPPVACSQPTRAGEITPFSESRRPAVEVWTPTDSQYGVLPGSQALLRAASWQPREPASGTCSLAARMVCNRWLRACLAPEPHAAFERLPSPRPRLSRAPVVDVAPSSSRPSSERTRKPPDETAAMT